ncbi:hypothetical protein J2X14_002408 [Pantoea alhagi]|uniref:hypothetical protein n=1 Tax=Mixta sp. BE291 TaxID=3158787 RepID=UPI00285B48D6|nr:hypothetical protein [Pantoea alhagi]
MEIIAVMATEIAAVAADLATEVVEETVATEVMGATAAMEVIVAAEVLVAVKG